MKDPKRYWAQFPWTPRDLRRMLALVASIFGAGVMTSMAAWLIWIVWKGGWSADTAEQRISALAWALFGTLLIIGITISAFGLAINPRRAKGNIGAAGFEISGGEEDEDEPEPIATVKTTTTVTASDDEKPVAMKKVDPHKYGD